MLDDHDQFVILLDRTLATVSAPKCLSINASALSRWRSDTPRASSSQPKTQLLITPSNPTEACTIQFGGSEPQPLTDNGRPDGVPRYTMDNPVCPLRFDLLLARLRLLGPLVYSEWHRSGPLV